MLQGERKLLRALADLQKYEMKSHSVWHCLFLFLSFIKYFVVGMEDMEDVNENHKYAQFLLLQFPNKNNRKA